VPNLRVLYEHERWHWKPRPAGASEQRVGVGRIRKGRVGGAGRQRETVKHTKLGKLKKDGAVWIYEFHGLNIEIIEYLLIWWPLDYGRE